MAPISAPKMTCPVDDVRRDDPGADGLRHMQAKEQEGDEIEERSPDDRDTGRKHARRDHRRDRICGVMQPVEKIEDEGDRDQRDKQTSESGIAEGPRSAFRRAR